MLKDCEKAKLLLDLLDSASFPGSQRLVVMELAEWLETIKDGRVVTRQSDQ